MHVLKVLMVSTLEAIDMTDEHIKINAKNKRNKLLIILLFTLFY